MLLCHAQLVGTKLYLPRRGCVYLKRAKGFTWISLVRQILVLMPRFDCEFVMIFQGHGLSAAKMVNGLYWNSTLFSTKACVSINELIRE